MNQSIEYCSLHYLNMWLKHDRNYHATLKSKSKSDEEKLSSLKEAAHYYKVSRNLPKKHDEGKRLPRYEPVLEIINDLTKSDFSKNPTQSIKEIEGLISGKYRVKSALSFTTKMLWLKIQDPIIIYDSKVRIALNTPSGDLPSFHEAWQYEYDKKKEEIASACEKLSKLSKYSYDQTLTPSDIYGISQNPWFQKRVFDMYLWHNGKD